MLKLKLILGSTRPNRTSEKLVPWLTDSILKKGGFEIEVLDLRDHALPFYDQATTPSQVKDGNYPTDAAKAWAAKIADGDVFLIISPEYNHSFTAVLKNALDTVYAEWNNKAVGFVGYGSAMGARAIEQLRIVAAELQMASVRQGVYIPAPWALTDEKGALKDGVLEQHTPALNTLLEQLASWGSALATTRK